MGCGSALTPRETRSTEPLPPPTKLRWRLPGVATQRAREMRRGVEIALSGHQLDLRLVSQQESLGEGDASAVPLGSEGGPGLAKVALERTLAHADRACSVVECDATARSRQIMAKLAHHGWRSSRDFDQPGHLSCNRCRIHAREPREGFGRLLEERAGEA